MKYKQFEIINFKGIQNLTFELDNRTPISKIFTLVGLNESGKTTILEALGFFYDNVKDEKELTITKSIVDDVHELIPKSKKSLFTDSISVVSTIKLEQNDKNEIKKFLVSEGYTVVNIADYIEITVKLDFKDSNYIEKQRLWSKHIGLIKKKIDQKFVSKSIIEHDKKLWGSVTDLIAEKLLPAIIYYPNFLFDFPDQILLEEQVGESKEQMFYRNVLQDILASIDKNLLLKEHIVDRVKSGLSKDIDSTEAVVNKMSGQVTRFLTKNKMNVFSKLLEKKEIAIKYPKKNNQDKIYLEIKLKSGDDEYYIRERSLGFRWFFTYLLFTQFRIFRDGIKNLVFLFDEPASNLHQTGQQRLLEAFGELTTNTNAFVMYSTHSHHLINPHQLESTYIVKNNALNYDDESEYNSFMTDISILRYREFIAKNPSQVNYFQPILDVLEYKPSNLEYLPDIIMLEGKNDFYTLNYFNSVLNNRKSINFAPGMSSSSLDTLIQLYYSWGKNFVVLLDGDKEGVKQKKRYLEKFGSILNNRLFILSDLDAKWKNKELEDLFENDDALAIQKAVYKNDIEFDKKKFNLSIQELLITSTPIGICKETHDNLANLTDFLLSKV
ncbi:MAG: AAA family ATPase [Ferruginibacter sp.]